MATLSVDQLHNIISAIQFANIVIRARDTSNSRACAGVYLFGAASMYRKSEDYINRWLEFMESSQDAKDSEFASRISHRQYEEVAAVLGEEPCNPLEAFLWFQACGDIADLAQILCTRNTGLAEIAAHAK